MPPQESNMASDLIFYQFSRVKVERGDFHRFFGQFALDKLPTGRRLRAMMNSMVFCVEGYDDDPRETSAGEPPAQYLL